MNLARDLKNLKEFSKDFRIHCMSIGPDPNERYPIPNYDKLVFLKHFVKAPNIFIGDYTYFDDRRYGPERFEENNVLYNYNLSKVKLVIGKFCALAAETRFIMTGDHKLNAISTYPFPVFQRGWEIAYSITDLPVKGDILIGNDVWCGYDSLIMNGVTIGHGAIVAARATVVKNVPPYAIVAGNPAKIVKMRFDDRDIERLLKIAWWDWEIEKINRNLPLICNLDIDRLEEVL
jgi:virginiamycin A acetyltransferase